MTSYDQRFLDLALRLADRQLGRTGANPAVGCVIVKNAKVMGQGATADGGRPHAETIALEMAGDCTGADVYVTLEPCAHYGKTPPCAEALIKARPARVICPIQDPDPRVSGNGFAMLRAAGIEVIHPKIALPASLAPFITAKTQTRPLVTLKTATTIDGKIALSNGVSQWITSERTRQITRAMRAKYDAIMIGSGTLIADNPSLNIRQAGLEAYAPRPVIMDTHLRSPVDAKIFAVSKPIVFCAQLSKTKNLNAEMIEIPCDGAKLDLNAALRKLAELGYHSVLIEGGSELAASALKAGVVDEVIHVQAGKMIGADGIGAIGALGHQQMDEIQNFQLLTVTRSDDDLILHYARPTPSLPQIWP